MHATQVPTSVCLYRSDWYNDYNVKLVELKLKVVFNTAFSF